MRVKRVVIGIQTLEEGLRKFAEAADAAIRGERRKREDGVFFTSLEAMRRVLTPRRLELLHLIREKAPGSVYQLAGLAQREIANVQDDVALLARVGLVTLRLVRTPRRRVVPRVPYDQLQVHIPLIYVALAAPSDPQAGEGARHGFPAAPNPQTLPVEEGNFIEARSYLHVGGPRAKPNATAID